MLWAMYEAMMNGCLHLFVLLEKCVCISEDIFTQRFGASKPQPLDAVAQSARRRGQVLQVRIRSGRVLLWSSDAYGCIVGVQLQVPLTLILVRHRFVIDILGTYM